MIFSLSVTGYLYVIKMRKGKISARLKIQDLPTTLVAAGLEKAA